MTVKLKLRDVATLTKAEFVTGEEAVDREIPQACAADLLSDVLALVQDEGVLLLTGALAPQVLRVAEVLGLGGVLFVRGKRPTDAMCDYARQACLPLLVTELSMYEASGILYSEGLRAAPRRRMSKGRGC